MGPEMMERLLDSVILIDHLNGIRKATSYIQGINPLQTAISVITRAEIFAGLDKEGQLKVMPLLNQYRLLIIDKPIADLAADLRREFGWKLPDAFQASLAKHHQIKLATRNTKDFSPRKHGFVEIPYSL